MNEEQVQSQGDEAVEADEATTVVADQSPDDVVVAGGLPGGVTWG